jgi:cysteine desulfurase
MLSNKAEPVYLDYAATTPVDPQVAEAMSGYLTVGGTFANPSSTHAAGRRSAAAVESAREQLAGLLNVGPHELIWTSGATESDNLGIIGAARFRSNRGKHLVTMPTEHKAVTDSFQALEREGFEVTYLMPDTDGLLALDEFEAAIRDDTQLVSVMHVNNETGVIQDIRRIGEHCRQRDILLHVDAAQSVGKLPIDLSVLPVDLLSLTAHKLYGPKGVGALYMADRPGCHVLPLFHGGGQERGLRPGTLPVHQIVGLGAAASIAKSRLSVSIEGIEGESLMLALEPLCIGSGSACNSINREPSPVLQALGRDDALAQSAIRFSFGRDTTDDEIDLAIGCYTDAIVHLRAISPQQVRTA